LSSGTKITERYNDSGYLQSNPTWHAEDSPWKARQVMRILERNAITPGTLCEVGCGAGEILVNLSRQMKLERVEGYDLSADAYAICSAKSQGNLRFFHQDINDTEAHYDVLICMDVFEHVEDYLGFVRNLGARAEYKIFHVPLDIHVNSLFRNGMMRGRAAVGHLHYFVAETALATIEDAGLEIVDSFFTAPFARDGVPHKTAGARLMAVPRRVLFSLSPNLLSKTLGGCSLLVLAR